MATLNTYINVAITNIGGAINIPATDPSSTYLIDGTGITLSGDLTIATSDSPVTGINFKILWNGNGLVKGANNITIFGVALTAQQALGKVAIEANYNGSAFVAQTHASFDGAGIIGTSNIADGAISTAKIAAVSVGAAQIADAAITTAKITDGNITTAKIAANAITAALLSTQLANFSIVFPVSFETGYAGGNFTLFVEHDIKITTVKSAVIKTLAGTDAGTINVFLQGNNIGALAIPLSSAQGVLDSLTTTGTTSQAYTGTPIQIRIEPTKTTSGGVVLVTLLCSRQI